MFFPSSGIEVAVWIPPCVAFAVSFFTSMGGVSGAFLLLPFQISFLGYTSPSVSSTNQVYNIVAIPSGVYRYWREGRMVWPLTWVVILGTLPGVLIGAIVRVAYLPDARNFKLFAAGVLLYIGFKMLRGLLKDQEAGSNKNGREKGFQEIKKRAKTSTVAVTAFNIKRISYTYYDESFEISFVGVFILSLIVGIIGGIYGIGGGAIIAPFLVTLFGLPVYTVAGAALMGTFVTSVAGVVFYEVIAPYYPGLSVSPDWLLGILFGVGGTAGMYLGARCQKYVPATAIKWMLSVIIIGTAFKYAFDFFSN